VAAFWPVVVGFLLTTVLGGFLGSLFQRRVWNHQHVTQIMTSERTRSIEIFEEVSRLLDKRLYRLRLLYWSLPAGNSRGVRSQLAEQRLDDYRQILFDWNDGINRNLALIQQYFGDEARFEFDHVMGIHFIQLGRMVEHYWNSDDALDPVEKSDFEGRLHLLGRLIYHYNISLLQTIRANSMTRKGRTRSGLPGRPLSAPEMAIEHLASINNFQRPEDIRAAFAQNVKTSNSWANSRNSGQVG
jgi:hypothetical protein